MLRKIFFALLIAVVTASAADHAHAQSAASELIHLWDDANDRCRDGRGTETQVGAACDERERYSKRLDQLGFCYGHMGDTSSDMFWHHCDARSVRPGGALTAASSFCVVNDPTPTPLNYRTAPYGRVLGNVENGRHVTIIDRATDSGGKPWVYIADENKHPIGWVFRQYIECF